MVVLREAMDSLMYEVDRVSAMIVGKSALIPIVKSLGKPKSEGKKMIRE